MSRMRNGAVGKAARNIDRRGDQARGSTDPLELDEQAIRAHVDERSFRRGAAYHRDGAIFDAGRQENRLSGRCKGASASSYRVEAVIKNGRIGKADCSCPVGEGGHCKHVAALLLTWRADPGRFRSIQPIGERLAGLSRDDLVALVEAMVEQRPELESLVAEVSSDGTSGPVESHAYRERAIAALSGEDWEVVPAVALSALRSTGDRFANRNDFRKAAAVYRGILEGAVHSRPAFEVEYDDEAMAVVSAAAESLARCLGRLDEEDAGRSPAADALFDLLRFDLELGGMGSSDEALHIAAGHLTPDERADFAERIDDLGDEVDGDWAERRIAALALEFEGDQLDDEAFLKRCRRQRLMRPLVERLLALGRDEEAVAALKEVEDHELPGYADLFVERDRPDAAERIVRKRLGRRSVAENWWLAEWLQRFYTAREDWPKAMELAKKRFADVPDRTRYLALRDFAIEAAAWGGIRAEVDRLVARRASPTDRIRIALDEGEIESAVRGLQKSRGGRAADSGLRDLCREVARAAEESFPEDSLAIYWSEVELLVLGRGREAYRMACEHLTRLRDLSRRLGRDDEWRQGVAAVREENPRLRALHDELRNAGL